MGAPDPWFPGPSGTAAAQQASQPDHRRRHSLGDRSYKASVRDVSLGSRAGEHGEAGGREREVVRAGTQGGWRMATQPPGRADVPRHGRRDPGLRALWTQHCVGWPGAAQGREASVCAAP